MSGWMISHNESSINAFAIPRISPIHSRKYSHFVRRSKLVSKILAPHGATHSYPVRR
jgi:hypothetical protein